MTKNRAPSSIRKRQDRLAAAVVLRQLANMLDGLTLNEHGQIVKFNQNHDEKGRFATADTGLDAGPESVLASNLAGTFPHSHAGMLRRAQVYLHSPAGRHAVARGVGIALATVGAHYADQYAAIAATDFISNHLGLGYDAASLAALAVGLDGLSKKLGLSVEKGAKAMAHAARAASRFVTSHLPHDTPGMELPALV